VLFLIYFLNCPGGQVRIEGCATSICLCIAALDLGFALRSGNCSVCVVVLGFSSLVCFLN